jgi:NAD(P)-dependent dehydrogenase (short-subunit alcohol dehydrogenase family)
VGEPTVEKVLIEIRQAARRPGDGSIRFMELDLASLKSVRKFSEAYQQEFGRLDILVNNAGVSLCPYRMSQDGLELHFAVNHLGHFYLTELLMDQLLKSHAPRMVIVSSRHHHDSYEEGVRLTVDAVNRVEGYHPGKAYGHSKLCNLLFMQELHRRFHQAGQSPILYVNAAHPGFVNAQGITRHIAESMGKFTYHAGRIFQSLVALSVPDGALTQIYLAGSPEIEDQAISGAYYGPIAEPYEMSDAARDPDLAARLWTFSRELIRLKTAGTPA